MATPEDPAQRLAPLLDKHRPMLVRFLARTAPGLLRFESADDLAQMVHLQALQGAAHYEDQGAQALDGWLRALAQQVIARRHAHWHALKRDAGAVLRWSSAVSSTGDVGQAGEPMAKNTGPMTHADRREQLKLATRALASLLPRDQEVLRSWRNGEDAEAIANKLGISRDAAERARQRALERFQKAFTVLRDATAQ